MRVLFFLREYTTHDRRYLSSLVQADHQVVYLRLERGPVAYETRDRPVGVQAVPWSPFRWWMWPRLFLGFRRVLRDIWPQLVHADPVPSCAFLAAVAGAAPLVVMSWGSDVLVEAERNPVIQWMTRYTLRKADTAIESRVG